MDLGPWLFVLEIAVLAAMSLASEIGFRAGRRAHPRKNDAVSSEVGVARATTFAILGLLVAFTVSMAEERFSHRRRLIIDEANAIGTTYLRSQYLLEPHPGELAPLFRRYVDARVAFYAAGADIGAVERETARTDRLQHEIWAHAIEVVREDPSRSATNAAFVQSLNEMIDLEDARFAALSMHVPITVLVLVVLVGLLACATNGYACGLTGRRAWASVAMLPLLVGIATSVVIDLDSPRVGFASTGQVPFERLQASLAEDEAR